MSQQDADSIWSGLVWCLIFAIVVGVLFACGILNIDDLTNGAILGRSENQQARESEEFGLVVACSVVSSVIALVIFGIWKAVSNHNSPEQERKRILRRHPPFHG